MSAVELHKDRSVREAEWLSAAAWPARLSLDLTKMTDATRLARNVHSGPLRVQRPFYPEGPWLPHIYLLHPPGGLVTGDDLSIDISIHEHAGVLFTTPGAGRIYRARTGGGLQRQTVFINQADGSHLDWFPGETLYYPGAGAELLTGIHLVPGATVCGWEINGFGLPASGRSFTGGTIRQRLEIVMEGRPVLLDTQRVEQQDRTLLTMKSGLSGHVVSGMFYAGPFYDTNELDSATDACRQLSAGDDCLTGVSGPARLLVARYLGNSAWQARNYFSACWEITRPLLTGRVACRPRIWAT